jgi:hypothetical protein
MSLSKLNPDIQILPTTPDMDIPVLLKARYPDMMENVYCGIYCPRGWVATVVGLCDVLVAMGFNGKVAQIKEKFGALRFYVDGATETEDSIISEVEARTAKICEECGCPGKLDKWGNKNWIRTLCETHGEEWANAKR